MSDRRRPEPTELTLVTRDALVRRLIGDLASPDGGAVRDALRMLDAGGDAGLPADRAQRAAAHDRLRRYLAALEQVPIGSDLPTRLAQARVLFAHALFFEVHEVLEAPWRDAAGDERRVLQGVIQAAVAWHHGARGRSGPALRAASAAAAKLVDAPPTWHGFPVAALRALLDGYRDGVGRGEPPGPPAVRL